MTAGAPLVRRQLQHKVRQLRAELNDAFSKVTPGCDAAAVERAARLSAELLALDPPATQKKRREDWLESQSRELLQRLGTVASHARAEASSGPLAAEVCGLAEWIEQEAARAQRAKAGTLGRWTAAHNLERAAGLLQAAANCPDRGLLYSAAYLCGSAAAQLDAAQLRKHGGRPANKPGTKRAAIASAFIGTPDITGGQAALRTGADDSYARRVLRRERKKTGP